jgi:hypothetical protein
MRYEVRLKDRFYLFNQEEFLKFLEKAPKGITVNVYSDEDLDFNEVIYEDDFHEVNSNGFIRYKLSGMYGEYWKNCTADYIVIKDNCHLIKNKGVVIHSDFS